MVHDTVVDMTIDWTTELVDQLDWHWTHQARPRLDGLSDAEYLWEPVDGCWSVRPRGEPSPATAVGDGAMTIDYAFDPPQPTPFTTIAWRIAHVVVGVFAARTAGHFGGAPVGYDSWPYAGTAAEALEQLDAAYAAWVTGARGLSTDDLAQPCGPAEGPYAEMPMVTLVLHINREAIHHLAEVACIRDLYAHRARLVSR